MESMNHEWPRDGSDTVIATVAERRCSRRESSGIAVRVSIEAGSCGGLIRDICPDAAFIETSARLVVGDAVFASVVLPMTRSEITLRGHVVRVVAGGGAVLFDSDNDQRARALVSALSTLTADEAL
jgi:hypothetical protein